VIDLNDKEKAAKTILDALRNIVQYGSPEQQLAAARLLLEFGYGVLP
jgi:hypothetical protein